jgi:hypothetical protein
MTWYQPGSGGSVRALASEQPAWPLAVAGAVEAEAAKAAVVAAVQVAVAILAEHGAAPAGAFVCLDVLRGVLRAELAQNIAAHARLALQPPPLAPDLVSGNQRSIQLLCRLHFLRLDLDEQHAGCLRGLRATASVSAGLAARRRRERVIQPQAGCGSPACPAAQRMWREALTLRTFSMRWRKSKSGRSLHQKG